MSKMLRKLWLMLRCCSRKWSRGISLWSLSVWIFRCKSYLISSSPVQVDQLVLACSLAPGQPLLLVAPLDFSSHGFWLELCWSTSLRYVMSKVLWAQVANSVLGNWRNVDPLSRFGGVLYVGSSIPWSIVRIFHGLELCISVGCCITSGDHCSSNYSELLAK